MNLAPGPSTVRGIRPGGYRTQYKFDPMGMYRWLGYSKISHLVHERPLIKCKIWYVNELIFQTLPIWAKIGSNLRKFWENLAILLKLGPKLDWLVCINGSLFSWKICIYGSSFKFRGGTSLPKPNLSTPLAFRLHYGRPTGIIRNTFSCPMSS